MQRKFAVTSGPFTHFSANSSQSISRLRFTASKDDSTLFLHQHVNVLLDELDSVNCQIKENLEM